MKKNPIIYLEKYPENNKKTDIQNAKKVKTKLEMYVSSTCT